MRSTAREYSLIKPFTDVAERIQSLLDYRLVVIDNALVLTATFDRAWEPYMRLIWQPLGAFLDLLFCNCDGYPPAADNDFETFAAWVRKHQLSSDFFFATFGLSVSDLSYLSGFERAQREGGTDLAACGITAGDPERAAAAVRCDAANAFAYNDMAMEALVALFRLTDHYRADRPDGDGRFLLRAAQDLLAGWKTETLPPVVRGRFAAQLAWFEQKAPPSLTRPRADPVFDPSDVQGGILDSYDRPGRPMTHGALLLCRIADAAAARRALGQLGVQSQTDAAPADGIFVNIAFTLNGLVQIGVPAADIAKFPPEFLEGMADRGSLIGDVRGAHSRRWRLPGRWTPVGTPAAAAPLELSEVDIVVQLRTSALDYPGHEIASHSDHPLFARIDLLAALPGLDLLAVEPMRRAALTSGIGVDHFGFADNISQPKVIDPPLNLSRDEVPRGEILCGYANARGDPGNCHALQLNGSFLVVRKLKQDQPRLAAFVEAAVAGHPTLDHETIYAKLIGRRRDGAPLLPGTSAGSNEFDYSNDPDGAACPFQAHIRRTNPRTSSFGRPGPRLMRRGMSFGPTVDTAPTADRGTFFMAYNASIAEQYEVVQRWINGGNSTDVASSQNDPIMGVAETGNDRVFRFTHADEVVRLKLPTPFVELMWGSYLFAPSMSALQQIANQPAPGGAPDDLSSDRGDEIIADLDALARIDPEAAASRWKIILEDFFAKDPDEDAVARQVWTAISRRGGALRIPYPISVKGERFADGTAVLVGDRALVLGIFENAVKHYSVAGYQTRLATSIGEIYLGEDTPTSHDGVDVGHETNTLLLAVTEAEAFEVARRESDHILDMMLDGFQRAAPYQRSGKIDLKREYFAPVLAEICRHWFGIPDDSKAGAPARTGEVHVEAGTWDWRDVAQRKPRCTGDYMAPSRFVFSPDPVAAVQDYGRAHGSSMRAAVAKQFAAQRSASTFAGPIMPKMAALISDDDLLARTIIGVMTGFLPPTDAALRWSIYDWSENKTLWRVQQSLASSTESDPLKRADALRKPLIRAMQKRPAPDLLWRTVADDAPTHQLGQVEVFAKDRIIVGIAGATLNDPAADATPIFGGNKCEHIKGGHHSHACPAYAFAMGTMLGILGSLLERGRLETLPAPLIVKLTDTRPATGSPQPGG